MPPKRKTNNKAISDPVTVLTSEESDTNDSNNMNDLDADLDKLNTKQILKKIYKKLSSYDEMKIEIRELKNSVVKNSREIEKLKRKLEEKELENKSLKSHLEKQDSNMLELNQRSRMTNIVINGIKEVPNENVVDVVSNLGNGLGITNPTDHVQVAHRIASKSEVKPIVVRMLNTKTRDVWVRAAREMKLREKNIYVSEHLTVHNYQLLQNVKKWARSNGHRYVWTQDCRILMRKEDKSKVRCIKSMKELDPKWISTRPNKDETDSE